MAQQNKSQPKAKTGLARCLELASGHKGLVFLSGVLAALAAICSFVPYSCKNNKSSGAAGCKNYPYHCYDCKRIQGRCRKVYGSRNERTSCKAVG